MGQILQLYEANKYGIVGDRVAPLPDCQEATVRRVVNGEYSLTFSMPPGSKNESEIKVGRAVRAMVNEYGVYQYFIIKNPARSISGGLNVYAEHQSYIYNDLPIVPFLNGGQNGGSQWTFQQAHANLATDPFSADWIFSRTNKSGGGHLLTPKGAREFLLNDLVGQWGGEFDFYGFNIEWVDELGGDNGAQIVYARNLLDLNIETVLDDWESGIYPYWGEAGSSSRPLVQLDERIASYIAAINAPLYKIRPVDFSDRFESQPTQEQLRAAAGAYTQQHAKAEIPLAYTLQRIKVEGDENIDLGDTVTIRHPKWSVNAKARIVGLVFDAIRGRVQDIDINAVRPTLAGAIISLKNK